MSIESEGAPSLRSEFARELVRAARTERSPRDAQRRAMLALGIGSGFLTATWLGALGSALAKSLGTTSVKWLALFAAVAAAGGGITYYGIHDRASAASRPMARAANEPLARAARQPTTGGAPNAAGRPSDSAVTSSSTAASSVQAAPKPAARKSASALRRTVRTEEVGAPQLAEEVAALDAVRSAIALRDLRRAKRLLGDYEARYPKGRLGAAAARLKIELLMVAGEERRAKALAESFRKEHPDSPLRTRVDTLVDGAGNE